MTTEITCSQCGGSNSADAAFCRHCALPLGAAQAASQPTQKASGRAITAMIVTFVGGLIGIFACGPLTTIPGIILGMTELNAIRQGRAPKAGETYAKVSLYGSIGTTALATLSCILGSVLFMWWMK